MSELPRIIPLDPEVSRPPEGSYPPYAKSEIAMLRGLQSTDGGDSWFDFGDPFNNRLCLVLAQFGDDWTGTLYYAGLPCLVVVAGGTRDVSTQYEREIPAYTEDSVQEIHAMFFELIGTLPSEDFDMPEFWPFPHGASNMVHENRTTEFVLKYRPEQKGAVESAPEDADGKLMLGKYDLYHDLMEFGGGEGHEIVEITGIVARAMCAALKDEVPEFAEGGAAHEALRGF